MRVYDLIAKKRDGGTHSREELEQIVNGYVSGEVTDYQMAAWMMAVYLRGMTDEETAELTDVMRQDHAGHCPHRGGLRREDRQDERPGPWPYRRHHR